jgi:subtilisin-like proprotein convertase family protein
MRLRCAVAAATLLAAAGIGVAQNDNTDSGDTDTIVLSAPDAANLLQEDAVREARGLAPRFAVREPVALTPANSGEWRQLDDGYAAWTLRISSRGVENINLGFTRFDLPPFASLHIAATDGSKEIRPFTDADNNQHQELWTPVLPVDDVTIELIVPEELARKADLQIGYINLGYRPFGAPLPTANRDGACNVDVVCPEGDPWDDEIDSVGVISTGGSTFCTGFMVNNVRQDRRPLFMTAYHCGVRSSDAPSLVVYWNFENSFCRPPGSAESGGPGDGTLSDFNTGSTLLAEGSTSDFTLVELNNAPAEDFEVAFSGWDANFYEPVGVVGIHHPSTDEKRISFEFDQTASTVGLTDGPEVPVNQSTHVKVPDWDVGTTEPGSSGSPLYDLNTQRVIGQLHGGAAACGNDLYDSYGRIARSWDNGSPGNSLRFHLDPDDTGALFVDTLPAAGAVLTPGADFFAYGVVGGPFTDDSVDYTLENTSLTPVDFSISIVAGGDLPLLLDGAVAPITGTLPVGGSLAFTVALDPAAASLSAGEYATEVLVEDLTNGASVVRNHTLEVGLTGVEIAPADGLLAGGPVGGPFNATKTYTITSTRPTPVTFDIVSSANWFSVNGGPSDSITLSNEGDSADVVVAFTKAAGALPAGLATGAVTFANMTDGRDSTTREVILDVGRFRFAADDTPQNITDNSSITSTIDVTDSFCIADVNVDLDITHTFIGDLEIDLTSPDGTTVRLHNRTGSSSDDIQQTYDEGVIDADGPGSLSDFNDAIAAGTWTLTISDNAGADEGALNNWELQIAASNDPCPPSVSDIAASTGVDTPVDITLDAASPNSGTLDYIVTALPANGRLFLPGTTNEITAAPATLPADTVTYLPDLGFGGADTFTYNADDGQAQAPEDAQVSVGVVSGDAIFAFPLDVDPGFDTTGDWGFGQPAGEDGDPTSGFTGDNVYGYNLNGAYPDNMGEEFLTTPALDFTDVTGVSLKFRRWLGVERSAFDFARIQVSTDDATWQTIWTNPEDTSIEDDAWQEVEYDIAAIADNQPEVYVRWVMGESDFIVNFAGWNIDDITFTGATPTCTGDLNGDGSIDGADLVEQLSNFGQDVLPNQGGDLNGDGRVDGADLVDLLSVFGTSC